MKKVLLYGLLIASVTTNCSASEIANTAKTVTDGLGTVTSAAVFATGGESTTTTSNTAPPVSPEESTPEAKGWKPKWFLDAQKKLDEVAGGRDAIIGYKQQVVSLQAENRRLKADAKFMNKNGPEFISAMEQACMMFDAGGIRTSLEVTRVLK